MIKKRAAPGGKFAIVLSWFGEREAFSCTSGDDVLEAQCDVAFSLVVGFNIAELFT